MLFSTEPWEMGRRVEEIPTEPARYGESGPGWFSFKPNVFTHFFKAGCNMENLPFLTGFFKYLNWSRKDFWNINGKGA